MKYFSDNPNWKPKEWPFWERKPTQNSTLIKLNKPRIVSKTTHPIGSSPSTDVALLARRNKAIFTERNDSQALVWDLFANQRFNKRNLVHFWTLRCSEQVDCSVWVPVFGVCWVVGLVLSGSVERKVSTWPPKNRTFHYIKNSAVTCPDFHDGYQMKGHVCAAFSTCSFLTLLPCRLLSLM
jgi:hypothetical protein